MSHDPFDAQDDLKNEEKYNEILHIDRDLASADETIKLSNVKCGRYVTISKLEPATIEAVEIQIFGIPSP